MTALLSPGWLTIGVVAALGAVIWLALRSSASGVVRRGVAALRGGWRTRRPAVVEARVVDFGRAPAVTVYVVCAGEAERPALEDQVGELTAELRAELRRRGAADAVVDGVRLRATSREAVAREGGWWGYVHNVP